MIDPKELRIGNYVNSHFGTSEVFDLLNDCLAIEGHEMILYEDIEGIPITEEWLLKFGFRGMDKYTFVKDGLFIYHRKRGFVYGSKKNGVLITSIHQLQNLYYALTGKELTI